jgi:hypothetical protein
MIPAWCIQYKDVNGRWRRVKVFKEKEASRQHAAKLEWKMEQWPAELTDPHDDDQKNPLAKKVADFANFVANKSRRARSIRPAARVAVERKVKDLATEGSFGLPIVWRPE